MIEILWLQALASSPARTGAPVSVCIFASLPVCWLNGQTPWAILALCLPALLWISGLSGREDVPNQTEPNQSLALLQILDLDLLDRALASILREIVSQVGPAGWSEESMLALSSGQPCLEHRSPELSVGWI